jgi:hypothetical protein
LCRIRHGWEITEEEIVVKREMSVERKSAAQKTTRGNTSENALRCQINFFFPAQSFDVSELTTSSLTDTDCGTPKHFGVFFSA